MRPDWIEYRRGTDRELLGWIRPEGDGFVIVDLLGRDRSEPIDWLDAEDALENLGISYLADPWELRLDDGTWMRVRIAEVSPAGIRLLGDDYGAASAVGAPRQAFTLPFPAPLERLRPRG